MSDLVEEILKQRYYQEGEDWEKLARRVAHAVAKGEVGKGYEEIFYSCLLNKYFLPNSPTLMNAGTPGGTLSACFTVDVEDNMESIMNTIKDMALISKSGGGVGCNWSKLRGGGSMVGSTNGVASGPVSFLELVNTMGNVIVQGGKRRCAIMSVLDCDHPDIEKFITSKKDSQKLNNMNLSVMITDAFMEKVYQGDTKEKEVWDLICQTAHETGEPGLLFYERINQDNITPELPIRTTNPCGEEPMIPYSSCNLISIDVSKLVKNGKFDWGLFSDLIEYAVIFADSVIDINDYPLEKIKETTLNYRPIGLGILGLSHCLIKLGLVYGSEKSYEFAEILAKSLRDHAEKASIKLGAKYGCFPMCGSSRVRIPRRNGYLCSIAPTGTISSIAESSFSIEPLFSVAYTRNILNDSFTIVDPIFEEVIRDAGLDYERIVKLVTGKNSIQDIEEIPKNIRELFITAHDLTPEQHVRMVATFQEYIDTGVSKTVNMPSSSSIDNVDDLFKYAFENKVKGITIYRDGSRTAPISTGEKIKISTENRAPDTTVGITHRVAVACGHFLCNVSGIDEQPLKIINNATTGCCDANLHALQRIISLALRSGISHALITKQLDKVTCSACMHSDRATSKSCAAGMSSVIKLYDAFVENRGNYSIVGEKISGNTTENVNLVVCPNCNKTSKSYMKCFVCQHCGHSRCG